MRKAGAKDGLAAKATTLGFGHLGLHDLEHDLAFEQWVVGQVDPAHAALSEQAHELIALHLMDLAPIEIGGVQRFSHLHDISLSKAPKGRKKVARRAVELAEFGGAYRPSARKFQG